MSQPAGAAEHGRVRAWRAAAAICVILAVAAVARAAIVYAGDRRALAHALATNEVLARANSPEQEAERLGLLAAAMAKAEEAESALAKAAASLISDERRKEDNIRQREHRVHGFAASHAGDVFIARSLELLPQHAGGQTSELIAQFQKRLDPRFMTGDPVLLNTDAVAGRAILEHVGPQEAVIRLRRAAQSSSAALPKALRRRAAIDGARAELALGNDRKAVASIQHAASLLGGDATVDDRIAVHAAFAEITRWADPTRSLEPAEQWIDALRAANRTSAAEMHEAMHAHANALLRVAEIENAENAARAQLRSEEAAALDGPAFATRCLLARILKDRGRLAEGEPLAAELMRALETGEVPDAMDGHPAVVAFAIEEKAWPLAVKQLLAQWRRSERPATPLAERRSIASALARAGEEMNDAALASEWAAREASLSTGDAP